MPRSKNGIKRSPPDKDVEAAVRDVIERKMFLREAADKHKISKSAIARSVCEEKTVSSNTKFIYYPNFDVNRVLSNEDETDLVNYLKHAAYLHYGLTIYQTRKFPYEYTKNNEKVVLQWEENKLAGESWGRLFRQRQQDLSLRKLEATSLARSAAFNKNTVKEFLKNKNILSRGNFQPQHVWNSDESGCSTVHVPPKIPGARGAKQIGSMTSGEQGENVTIISAVNALGNSVPPLFVFPRVHLKQHMLKGEPPDWRDFSEQKSVAFSSRIY